jgi:hypothetical protein
MLICPGPTGDLGTKATVARPPAVMTWGTRTTSRLNALTIARPAPARGRHRLPREATAPTALGTFFAELSSRMIPKESGSTPPPTPG